MAATLTPAEFVTRWSASRGHEQKVDQMFCVELCEFLGVPTPDPSNEAQESYCFQHRVNVLQGDGTESPQRIDFYKRGHFVFESKQGSERRDKDKGTAVRGTVGWGTAMRSAFKQAHTYAQNLPEGRPPFIITCDIGYMFEVWPGFSGNYGGYGAGARIPFSDLHKEDVRAFLRAVFTDPYSLDPALHAARVTRRVSTPLAKLAKALEPAHGAERTSAFLMRCIFTMFAEDVNMLEKEPFKTALRDRWVKSPADFPTGISHLWEAMDKGTMFGFDKVLRFNGGLFSSTEALPLTKDQLSDLLAAAELDWGAVEPTIFGTLVEKALSAADRERLGAEFTPREYIERLIRPAMLEPLRDDWTFALGQSRQMIASASIDREGEFREPSKAERAAAADVLVEFHAKLCKLRVLDPACGSGNFLYVSFALLKDLEQEVLREIADLGDGALRLELESVSVNPSQFLGLDANPRAREIADLVLWIGYLQWHRRARGDLAPPDPVLRQYRNISCQDAVLAWDQRTEKRDAHGKPLTVWDMRTYAPNPVTREPTPSTDPSAQVPLYDYANPRAVEWPDADFIVSNPPFCGNKPMRKALGDSYTEALRAVYPSVPKTADLVMYWWEKAAALVRAGKVRRFGLITTNSITQDLNRGVVAAHTSAAKDPLVLTFAIPDHPWVIAGAAVRIAMTVGARASDVSTRPVLGRVTAEDQAEGGESVAKHVDLALRSVEGIHADLTGEANVAGAKPLRANHGLSFQGMNLVGEGFRLTALELTSLGYRTKQLPGVVKPYMNGRDLTQGGSERWVIDFFGLSAEQARANHPPLYQWVCDRVKPERDQNKRDSRRKNWWLFGEPVGKLRKALVGLSRFIATVKTAKHGVFTFVPVEILPDSKLYTFATADAVILGVLSTQIHRAWALASGAKLEDRPTYNNTTCFEPFPFPTPTEAQASRIRALAESLDAHRKSVLTGGFLAPAASTSMAADSAPEGEVTFTGMYNALERLREAGRGGDVLTYAERVFHDRALIGVLKSMHDDLDAAVAEAYGWPADLADDEILVRLVALNAERLAEEKAGEVRWLRPALQNPSGKSVEVQPEQVGLIPATQEENLEVAKQPWPPTVKAQLKATRDALLAHPGSWTSEATARFFTNAQKRIVERHLVTLEELGALVSYGVGDERRWGVGRGGG